MNTENMPPPLTLLSDLIGSLRADAEAAYQARKSGLPRGPVTGLSGLDEALGGFLQPGLHILQAAPGAGKTAFALQIASSCQFPALLVTAEMPTLELFRRLIARQTQTFLGKLKSGELDPGEVERLAIKTAGKLPGLAIMDAMRTHAEPGHIRDAAEGLRERLGGDQCLVVVDSLHVWAKGGPVGDAVSEYDLLNAALKSLVSIAAEVRCPLMVVAHRNRAGQEKGGLHAAKGTGSIEYLAETVIDLTPAEMGFDAAGERTVTAGIHKNRNGHAGMGVALKFSGRLQSFREGQ